MSYRVYTSDVTLPVTYVWKCSHCGEVNASSQEITTTGKTTSLGGGFNADASSMATFAAQQAMMGHAGVLSGRRGGYEQYRKMKLSCECKKCGHKEIWARSSIAQITKPLVIIGLVICALVAGYKLIFLDKWIPLLMLYIAIGLIGFYLISYIVDKVFFMRYMDKKLSGVDQLSFPHLVLFNYSLPTCWQPFQKDVEKALREEKQALDSREV